MVTSSTFFVILAALCAILHYLPSYLHFYLLTMCFPKSRKWCSFKEISFLKPFFLSELHLFFYSKTILPKQRSCQRWLDKRIYTTETKFWAVLGSRGCREKNLLTAISMQLFEVVLSTFCGQKNIFKHF